jgi:LemA protein
MLNQSVNPGGRLLVIGGGYTGQRFARAASARGMAVSLTHRPQPQGEQAADAANRPLAAGGWLVWAFNTGVKLRNQQREAWSAVEVQLKKRHDLVPALVECVKGYRAQEEKVFREVAEARTGNEAGLVRGLRGLLAVAEAYPELKASENFRQLTTQLVAIEDDLQYARRYFNGSVRDFRNFAETFPTVLVAGAFQFVPAEFFEVENVIERAVPEVKT